MMDGDVPMRKKCGSQLEEIGSHGPSHLGPAEQTERISVLDISGDIASARWSRRMGGLDDAFESRWTVEDFVGGRADRLGEFQSGTGVMLYRTSHSVAACTRTSSSL
jgi:hypothetical protein